MNALLALARPRCPAGKNDLKRQNFFICLFLVLAFSAFPVHGDVIDFNSEDVQAEFTFLKSQRPAYAGDVGILDQAGAAGGALSCKNNHSNIIYNTAQPTDGGGTFHISMLVRASSVSDDASTGSLHLGFATTTEGDFTGDSQVDLFGVRVEGTNTPGELKWSVRTDNPDEHAKNSENGLKFPGGNIFNATAGRWYLISASFTKSDIPDQWEFEASFKDFGESGTVEGTEVSSVAGTFSQAGTYNAAELFGAAAWRSNSGNVRFQEMDNFTISKE